MTCRLARLLRPRLRSRASGEMRREMKRFAWTRSGGVSRWLLLAGVTSGLPQSAAAAAPVDGCQDGDYVDATAAGANRTIVWDIFVASTAQRCLEIQVGQQRGLGLATSASTPS